MEASYSSLESNEEGLATQRYRKIKAGKTATGVT